MVTLTSSKQTPWTPQQIAHITANYGKIPDCQLAAESGHGYRAFRSKVNKLKLKRYKPKNTVPPAARAGFEMLVAAIRAGRLEF